MIINVSNLLTFEVNRMCQVQWNCIKYTINHNYTSKTTYVISNLVIIQSPSYMSSPMDLSHIQYTDTVKSILCVKSNGIVLSTKADKKWVQRQLEVIFNLATIQSQLYVSGPMKTESYPIHWQSQVNRMCQVVWNCITYTIR